jgi:hypothetical protein
MPGETMRVIELACASVFLSRSPVIEKDVARDRFNKIIVDRFGVGRVC